MEDKAVFTANQIKETIKADYLEKIKGKDDGEVLLYLLDELALSHSHITALHSEVIELKKLVIELKKLIKQITTKQEEIHKWYREQFKKLQGWRWWR